MALSSSPNNSLVHVGDYVLEVLNGQEAGGEGVVLRISKESRCHKAPALESCWIESSLVSHDGLVWRRCSGGVFLKQWRPGGWEEDEGDGV